jgi:hypothetical protein
MRENKREEHKGPPGGREGGVGRLGKGKEERGRGGWEGEGGCWRLEKGKEIKCFRVRDVSFYMFF